MGNYISYQNQKGQRLGLLCRECCRSVAGSRLVRKCWHPGCIRSCEFYDPSCKPEDGYKEADANFTCATHLLSSGAYQRHIRRSGECVHCDGTGLSPKFEETYCASCRGSGICPRCGGLYWIPEPDKSSTTQKLTAANSR